MRKIPELPADVRDALCQFHVDSRVDNEPERFVSLAEIMAQARPNRAVDITNQVVAMAAQQSREEALAWARGYVMGPPEFEDIRTPSGYKMTVTRYMEPVGDRYAGIRNPPAPLAPVPATSVATLYEDILAAKRLIDESADRWCERLEVGPHALDRLRAGAQPIDLRDYLPRTTPEHLHHVFAAQVVEVLALAPLAWQALNRDGAILGAGEMTT